MPNFVSLPGFRDFYPDDLAVRDYIFRVWRDVARRYGFQEYDGPPLEPTELYIEKSGPEIVQQLYNFADKGDREVALRPEMTPTLARMVGARAGGMRKPVKWFAIPQLFRYERQQRGRLREHFQLNFDIVGDEGVGADVELLAAAIDVCRAFGLTADDFVARISDRRLLRALLVHAGVPEDRLSLVYNIVDKLEREGPDGVGERLSREAGLGPSVVSEVLAIFAHRDFDAVRNAYGSVEEIGEPIARMHQLFDDLEAMGLSRFVRFDLGIVRGLAYYTGIVFELFDVRGELRAIAGGGRYDDLMGRVSPADLPALGFGMGDVVLKELLIDRGLLPSLSPGVDDYVIGVTPDERSEVLRLVRALRDAGRSVDYSLRPLGVGKQLKAASGMGARRALILGPDEVAAGVVVARDMAAGTEERVPLTSLFPEELSLS
ncbi:MAG: histidine--tRNA ligase [Gemmatimonadota bacterium]|jgi:histidyl-tRNA synthetase|nr:histidine--tRNA ligase [Gemmatimonadota bacterium]